MSKASILGVSCSVHKWNCGAILSLQDFNGMDSDLFMTRVAPFDAIKRFMESRLEPQASWLVENVWANWFYDFVRSHCSKEDY